MPSKDKYIACLYGPVEYDAEGGSHWDRRGAGSALPYVIPCIVGWTRGAPRMLDASEASSNVVEIILNMRREVKMQTYDDTEEGEQQPHI
jgi:hypothetical protein